MKKSTSLLTVVLLTISCCVLAQKKQTRFFFFKKKNKQEQKASPKVNEYDKLFGKEHQSAKGFITLHIVNGKIYFEFPLALIDREMLIGSTVSKISDNIHAVVGSKPTSPLHVKFTKNKDYVQLRNVSAGFMTNGDLTDRALENSRIPSIMENMKVLAYSPDSSAVVFDMTSFFVSDNKRMSPFDDPAMLGGLVRKETFKSGNSFPLHVKAFEDNVSVTSTLSYTYTLSAPNGLLLVDATPFTAEMTRSIMLLDTIPYRPRLADYRIGVFNTVRYKMGKGPNTTTPVYFANRWNVQPKDTMAYLRGELSEPVKPIIFYVDNTFPEQWKPYIKEGIGQWNEVFREIGFKNVIHVKDFPKNDPTFDPDNIKYSCVRYAPSNLQNAMGPSWVDPRSGEILTASVYVYHDVVKLIRRWLFVQTSQTDTDVRTADIPESILGDALRYVISHEIGHCLGFMHNMGASHTVPVDSLRSASYTKRHGTTPSIMDYARFNYVAQPGDKEKGVKLTPPRFGAYDRYLVSWTYRPVFGVSTPEEEAVVTSGWITDSIRKADYYRYGKQQFLATLDPRSQSEDLSNDAIRATQYGIKNLKYIAENMDRWISKSDDNYELRQEFFSGIVGQLLTYITHVANNVGGYESNEVKSTDCIPRYAPLSTSYQREALKYLLSLYNDLDWLDEAPVLSKVSISGSPKKTIQSYLQSLFLWLPIRVSTYELMAPDSYQSREAFEMVFNFVWNSKETAGDLSEDYMTLQTSYIKNMIGIAKSEKKIRMPERLGIIDYHLNETMGRATTHSCGISPVAGFEKVPYNRFAEPRVNKSDLYAYVMKAKSIIKRRIAVTNNATKAHYQVLLNMIEINFK